MIELRALGALVVRDSAGHAGRALHLAPRQAALLAYLALARPRGGIPRDRLLGVFWPELPEHRARASLRQALYRLRVELGRDVIATRGETHVEVLRDRVQCDVLTFEDVIAMERQEAALDLYAGDLLAGFRLSAAPEFEQWLDDERTRLRQLAIEAALTLARRIETGGNLAAAAHWMRRALVWAPYDEPLVRDLTRLLVATGDRTGAVDVYNAFAARLAMDLKVEPSASLSVAMAAHHAADAGGQSIPAVLRSRTDVAAEAGTGVATPRSSRGWFDHPARRIALFLSGAIMIGAVLVQAFHDTTELPSVVGPAGYRPNRVLVLPFENRTEDPVVGLLATFAADWITQSLQRTGLVEVIDARTAYPLFKELPPAGDAGFPHLPSLAERTQAGIVVWGSVSRQNGALAFRSIIADAHDGSVLRSLDPVPVTTDGSDTGVEILRSRVIGALASVIDERIATVVAQSSPPPTFEAYEHFARGVDEFTAANWQGALSHFERAADADSTFMQARFAAAYAMYNSGQVERHDSLIVSLIPLRERLPPVERAGLDVFAARMRGDWEAALRAARQAARLAPQSSWSNVAAALSLSLGRPKEALSDLEGLDPARPWFNVFPGYWYTRMMALHQLARYDDELQSARLSATYAADQPRQPQTHYIAELRALAALGRIEELNARLESIEALLRPLPNSGGVPFITYAVAVELQAHGFRDEAQRYFSRCVELYESVLPDLRTSQASCFHELGRHDEAAAVRSDAWTLVYPNFTPGVAAAIAGRREQAEQELASLDTLPRNRRHDQRYVTHFDQARIALLLGQPDRAISILREEPLRGRLWELVHSCADFDPVRNHAFIGGLISGNGISANGRSLSRE